MNFNKNEFRAALVRRGMSVTELANKLNINPVTLYRKMTGKSEFTRKEIVEICDCLELKSPMKIFFAS